MCDGSLKLSVKERTTTTADFSPQNPQSEPGHRLSSYTQTSSLAAPPIGSLIGSLEAE